MPATDELDFSQAVAGTNARAAQAHTQPAVIAAPGNRGWCLELDFDELLREKYLGAGCTQAGIRFESPYKRRQPTGLGDCIIVQERDVLDVIEIGEPTVVRGSEAKVPVELDDLHAGAYVARPAHAVVLRAVVDNHELKTVGRPFRSPEARQTTLEQRGSVVVDNDGSDARDHSTGRRVLA